MENTSPHILSTPAGSGELNLSKDYVQPAHQGLVELRLSLSMGHLTGYLSVVGETAQRRLSAERVVVPVRGLRRPPRSCGLAAKMPTADRAVGTRVTRHQFNPQRYRRYIFSITLIS